MTLEGDRREAQRARLAARKAVLEAQAALEKARETLAAVNRQMARNRLSVRPPKPKPEPGSL
jgi:hypothetical protein